MSNSTSIKSIYLEIFLILLFCIGTTFYGNNTLLAKEKVTLQLSWKHQFQFAGYYAALEKGFYSEAGFDVEIKEAAKGVSTIEEILNGNADFAIGDAEILTFYMNGKPIVLLASIFQHSPSILMVKASSNLRTPQDVVGKKLMLGEELNGLEILTMLYSEGLKKGQFTVVPQSFSVNELLSDKVDALGAYICNEPYFMDKFGIPYRIINPVNYGIDFYSDCLYCSQKLLKNKPERVSKFREASIKGWEYALAHQEEIAQLIISKYNSAKTIDHLMYEANEIKKLINPDFIEIGHTNKWRWQKIAEYLYQHGVIDKTSSIDDFLYSPNLSNKYIWLKAIAIAVAFILFVFAIFFFFHQKLTRSVEKRTEHIQALVKKLEEQNSEIHRINLDLIKAREIAKEWDENRFFFYSKLINELRLPINSLVDLTEQLCKPNLSGEKRQAVCSRVVFNSRIVFDFINDIIAISNVDESAAKTSFSRICLNDFFSDFINDIRKEQKLGKLSSIQLNQLIFFQNQKQIILADQEKLLRILSKLVNNSLKFTESGSIEVGCEQSSPNSIQLWIKDTGYGIKPEMVKRINAFFSEPAQTSASGIGLGLWVCKNLVQQMRGSIWVESSPGDKKESKGSKFMLQVPCVYVDNIDFNEQDIVMISDKSATFSPDLFRDKTFLILDKRIDNYNLIKIILKGMGCNLLYTDSIQDTISILLGYKKIDLLLTSIPSSKELQNTPVAEIRKNLLTLPIIAQVSFEVNQKDLFLAAGFNDVIQVPSNHETFLLQIAKFIQN